MGLDYYNELMDTLLPTALNVSGINDIYQDEKGALWFATENGLQFLKWPGSIDPPFGMQIFYADKDIISIYPDYDGNIIYWQLVWWF